MAGLVLASIELVGFMSYGASPQTFLFGGLGAVAVVGTNGSGKSSGVSRGLTWCLYGKCPPERMGSSTRMLKGRDVVNEDSKEARVSVRFFRSDKPKRGYAVTRTRNRSKSDEITVTNSKGKRIGNDQATIDGLIGAGYDTFVRTVVRGQNDVWNFAEATDTRKREIIDAISGSEVLSGSYDVARQRARSSGVQADLFASRAEDAERRIQSYDVSALEEKARRWAADHAKQVSESEGQVAALKAQLATAEAEDATMGDISVERAQLEADRPVLDFEPYDSAVNAAMGALSSTKAALQQAEARQRELEGLKAGESCPLCRGKVGPETAKALRAVKSDIVPVKRKESRDHARFYDEAVTARNGARAWLEGEEKAWSDKLSGLVIRPNQAPLVNSALAAAQGRLNDLKAAANPHTGTVEQATGQLYGLERESACFRALEAHHRYRALLASSWAELLAPKGVRAAIGDAVLAAIETGANSWLAVLSDGRMSVEFAPVKETRAGEKREIQTTIFVKKDDGSVTKRNILNFSGGERRRINIAVDLGVAAAFSAGGSLALSLLVLDEEVFSGLDEQGKVGVATAIHRSGVADVIVIDHDPALSGSLPRVIKVIREIEGSKVYHEDSRH